MPERNVISGRPEYELAISIAERESAPKTDDQSLSAKPTEVVITPRHLEACSAVIAIRAGRAIDAQIMKPHGGRCATGADGRSDVVQALVVVPLRRRLQFQETRAWRT